MTRVEDAEEAVRGELACLEVLLRQIEVSPPQNAIQRAFADASVRFRRTEVERAQRRLQEAQDAIRSRPLTAGEYASRRLLDSIEARREI